MDSPPAISRVLRTKQQARSAYDSLSRWYDALAAGSELPLANLGIQMLGSLAGRQVLEIGCGTGQSLKTLAGAVTDNGRVFGIDISGGMLAVTAKRIAGVNLAGRVALGQADAVCLPFKNGAFDTILMTFVLELFDNPEIPLVLAECRRVLTPGGRICVVAMARDQRENIAQRIYEWFHQRMPTWVDCRPIFVQAALKEAGLPFENVERRMMWGLPVEIILAGKPSTNEATSAPVKENLAW